MGPICPTGCHWEEDCENTLWTLKSCVLPLLSLSTEEVAARCPVLASHTLLTVAGQVGIDNVSARDSPHLSAPDALNTVDTAFLLTSPSNIQKPQIVCQLLGQPHSTQYLSTLLGKSIYDLNNILIFLSEIHLKQYELV